MLKFSELSGKTMSELIDMYQERKKEQFSLRLKQNLGTIVNTARMRSCRREIARIRTYMHAQKAK